MRTILLAVALGLSVGCATAPAPKAEHHAAVPVGATVIKPGEAKVGDTTTCPVSGETFIVAADSPKAEHDGKTYFFCCADCAGDFQKDPAKFTAKLH
jgi:YHS domain-containing protein